MRVTARGSAALALLMVGSAALALATQDGRGAEGGEPAVVMLDWRALALNGAAIPDTGLPFALLYVQAACEHCAAVATLVDSLSAVLTVPTLFVTNDSAPVAQAFARRVGLVRPMARDTAGVFRAALHVTAVPMLIGFRDGRSWVVVGAARPGAIRTLMRELQ